MPKLFPVSSATSLPTEVLFNYFHNIFDKKSLTPFDTLLTQHTPLSLFLKTKTLTCALVEVAPDRYGAWIIGANNTPSYFFAAADIGIPPFVSNACNATRKIAILTGPENATRAQTHSGLLVIEATRVWLQNPEPIFSVTLMDMSESWITTQLCRAIKCYRDEALWYLEDGIKNRALKGSDRISRESCVPTKGWWSTERWNILAEPRYQVLLSAPEMIPPILQLATTGHSFDPTTWITKLDKQLSVYHQNQEQMILQMMQSFLTYSLTTREWHTAWSALNTLVTAALTSSELTTLEEALAKTQRNLIRRQNQSGIYTLAAGYSEEALAKITNKIAEHTASLKQHQRNLNRCQTRLLEIAEKKWLITTWFNKAYEILKEGPLAAARALQDQILADLDAGVSFYQDWNDAQTSLGHSPFLWFKKIDTKTVDDELSLPEELSRKRLKDIKENFNSHISTYTKVDDSMSITAAFINQVKDRISQPLQAKARLYEHAGEQNTALRHLSRAVQIMGIAIPRALAGIGVRMAARAESQATKVEEALVELPTQKRYLQEWLAWLCTKENPELDPLSACIIEYQEPIKKLFSYLQPSLQIDLTYLAAGYQPRITSKFDDITLEASELIVESMSHKILQKVVDRLTRNGENLPTTSWLATRALLAFIATDPTETEGTFRIEMPYTVIVETQRKALYDLTIEAMSSYAGLQDSLDDMLKSIAIEYYNKLNVFKKTFTSPTTFLQNCELKKWVLFSYTAMESAPGETITALQFVQTHSTPVPILELLQEIIANASDPDLRAAIDSVLLGKEGTGVCTPADPKTKTPAKRWVSTTGDIHSAPLTFRPGERYFNVTSLDHATLELNTLIQTAYWTNGWRLQIAYALLDAIAIAANEQIKKDHKRQPSAPWDQCLIFETGTQRYTANDAIIPGTNMINIINQLLSHSKVTHFFKQTLTDLVTTHIPFTRILTAVQIAQFSDLTTLLPQLQEGKLIAPCIGNNTKMRADELPNTQFTRVVITTYVAPATTSEEPYDLAALTAQSTIYRAKQSIQFNWACIAEKLAIFDTAAQEIAKIQQENEEKGPLELRSSDDFLRRFFSSDLGKMGMMRRTLHFSSSACRPSEKIPTDKIEKDIVALKKEIWTATLNVNKGLCTLNQQDDYLCREYVSAENMLGHIWHKVRDVIINNPFSKMSPAEVRAALTPTARLQAILDEILDPTVEPTGCWGRFVRVFSCFSKPDAPATAISITAIPPQKKLTQLSASASVFKTAIEMPGIGQPRNMCSVPGDGCCLYYAVMLSVLLPQLTSDSVFNRSCEIMFGADIDPKRLNAVLRNYDGSADFMRSQQPLFTNLVNNQFRQRVVAYMRGNAAIQGIYAIEQPGASFDAYLTEQAKPNTYGGTCEIAAMQNMLGISIKGNRNGSPHLLGTDERRIEIHLAYTGTVSKEDHYNFILDLSRVAGLTQSAAAPAI